MPSGACRCSSGRHGRAGTDTRAGPWPCLSRHPGADYGALGVARAGPLSVPSARNLARGSVSVSCHRRAGPCLPCRARACHARGYRPARTALPRDRLAADTGAPVVPSAPGSARSPSGRLAVGACHRRAVGAWSARIRTPDMVGARVRASGRRSPTGLARGYRRAYGRRSARGYSHQRLCHPRSEFRRFNSRIDIHELRNAILKWRNATRRSRTGHSRVLIIQFLQNHNPNFAKFCSRYSRDDRDARPGRGSQSGGVPAKQ